MKQDRLTHLRQLYSVLETLEAKIGGARRLNECSGRMHWPRRGIYFFFENGEHRSDSGAGLRIVRVGTHALRVGAKTTLWTRLSQHKGRLRSAGGDHRSSIFRLLVGAALAVRHGRECASWGRGNTAPDHSRNGEIALEQAVTRTLGAMPVLWLEIDDAAGPNSQRGYIERNAIALLSNFGKPPLDPPSTNWLGRNSDRERVRNSGLWNSKHTDEDYDPEFIVQFERLVSSIGVA